MTYQGMKEGLHLALLHLSYGRRKGVKSKDLSHLCLLMVAAPPEKKKSYTEEVGTCLKMLLELKYVDLLRVFSNFHKITEGQKKPVSYSSTYPHPD